MLLALITAEAQQHKNYQQRPATALIHTTRPIKQ
jgi:hypothetical protein